MKSNSNSKEIHAERTEAVIQKTNMKTKICKVDWQLCLAFSN